MANKPKKKSSSTILWVRGNHIDQILSILAVTGEMGYRSLDILGDRDSYRHSVNNAAKPTAIKNTYTGEVVEAKLFDTDKRADTSKPKKRTKNGARPRKISLSVKAAPVLLWKDETNPYEKTLTRVRSREKPKIERRHRIAEVLAMMEMMGVPYWKNKVIPFGKKPTDAQPLAQPLFYSSLDLKDELLTTKEEKYGFAKSRAIGLYACETGLYPVYNIKGGIRKWNPSGEKEMEDLTGTLERNTFKTFKTKYGNPSSKCECIIMSDNYNTILGTMVSRQLDISEADSEAEIAAKLKAKRYADQSFAGMFLGVYGITLDANGRDILRMLSVPKHRPKIMNALFGSEWEPKEAANLFAYDAKTPNGGRAIVFADGDMMRFNNFSVYANEHPENYRYEVYCYPEQVEFVLSRMEKLAKIYVLDIQRVFDLLELGEAESAGDEEFLLEWQRYADEKSGH